MRDNKFANKSYDGYQVVNSYIQENYCQRYGKEEKPKEHRAYNYTLVNYDEQKSITLSGNQMRKIDKGDRKISEMFAAQRSRNQDVKHYRGN